MARNRSIAHFFRSLNRKRRLSLRKEHNDTEVWYMHISPLEMIGSVLAVLLILFIIILTLVAYTPILNMIPGYSGNRTREELIENIIKVDSIERKLNELEVYYNNVSLIMEGKTPITRNVQQAGDSVRVERQEAIPPSAEDSILRRQLEGSGIYSLSAAAAARQNQRQGSELVPPVKGIVAYHFSPKDGRYGVGVATATNQQVLAVDEGTVILSTWSPDEGHIIQIQHNGNLISTYKHSTQSLKSVGSRVRAGEVIGNTGEGLSGDDGKGLFEFELWQNGIPVDPETHILF